MKQELWFWPSGEEVNDFPDPVAFDAEWQSWRADLTNGPASEAEIFAREYVQNAWDSIQSEQNASKKESSLKKGRLTFSFVELSGKDAEKFYKNFGLSEFRQRYINMTDKNRKEARLGESELIQIDEVPKLRLLVCTESGGSGMWGHWYTGGLATKKGSRLRFALIQTASEKGEDGAGGSWGHGKKAIANASRCRTVAVYTCHTPKGENEDKPGVVKRFMGVAYWKRHQANGREHVGLGVLGKLGQSGQAAWQQFEPLENDEADAFIASLGVSQISLRDHSDQTQRGTTYLIVEPSFTPEDLVSAVERNWWPLTIQHKLPISVIDYDGKERLPEPEARPELLPFIDAFRTAAGTGGTPSAAIPIKVGKIDVGTLAVLADASENGYSYKSDIEDNTSLVALVRNDMVIAYLPSPRKQAGKPPFVRGALNVDRQKNAEASDLLKMAEPHLHNEWRTKPDGSTPRDAAALAKDVLNRIDRRVREVREEYSKPQQPKDLHFDIFASILSGKEQTVKKDPKPKPDPSPREFRIHDVSRASIDFDPKDATQVMLSATAKISLSQAALKNMGIMKAKVRVELGWKVLEEGQAGTVDSSLISATSGVWPKGFSEIKPGVAVGVLTALPVVFAWQSAYFPDDWQVLPFPKIELVEVLGSSKPSEQGAE